MSTSKPLAPEDICLTSLGGLHPVATNGGVLGAAVPWSVGPQNGKVRVFGTPGARLFPGGRGAGGDGFG